MHSRILMTVCAVALFTTGCGSCAEFAAEKALSAAGVEVDLDGQTMKIKGEDGTEIEFKGEGDDGTITVKGKDGELKLNGDGKGKVPDNFPIKVAAGAKVQGSASMNKEGERTWMLTLLNDGDPEKLAGFYEKELEGRGLKVERNDLDMNGEKFITIGGKAEGREASVALSNTKEEGTITQISFRETK